jgi:hypothetical protein
MKPISVVHAEVDGSAWTRDMLWQSSFLRLDRQVIFALPSSGSEVSFYCVRNLFLSSIAKFNRFRSRYVLGKVDDTGKPGRHVSFGLIRSQTLPKEPEDELMMDRWGSPSGAEAPGQRFRYCSLKLPLRNSRAIAAMSPELVPSTQFWELRQWCVHNLSLRSVIDRIAQDAFEAIASMPRCDNSRDQSVRFWRGVAIDRQTCFHWKNPTQSCAHMICFDSEITCSEERRRLVL